MSENIKAYAVKQNTINYDEENLGKLSITVYLIWEVAVSEELHH